MAKLSNAVKAARVVHNINKAALEINEVMTRAAYGNYVAECVRCFGKERARKFTGDKWSDVKLHHILFRGKSGSGLNLDDYHAACRGEKIALDYCCFTRNDHSFYTWSDRQICENFTFHDKSEFDFSGLTTEQILAYLYDLGFSSVEFAKRYLLLPNDKRTDFATMINFRIYMLYIMQLTLKYGWNKVRTLFTWNFDVEGVWSRFSDYANFSTRSCSQSYELGLPTFHIRTPWTVGKLIKSRKASCITSVANVFDGIVSSLFNRKTAAI